MKLYPINYWTIQDDPEHPLHDIYNQMDRCCDPEDLDTIHMFWGTLELPQGYYAAIIRDPMGWFIRFFQAVPEWW